MTTWGNWFVDRPDSNLYPWIVSAVRPSSTKTFLVSARLIHVAAMFGGEDDDPMCCLLDSVDDAIATHAEGSASRMRTD